MKTEVIDYPWANELEKTVVNSLVTTFGLDFLLFKDKVGGNVDTVHNVRKGIYATEQEKQAYEQRGNYAEVSHDYHSHDNYIETGRRDKALQQNGQLHDAYQDKTMAMDEKRNLDHIISAKEIHDDPGRVLAGCDGVELANKSTNLQSTSEIINKSKKEKSVDKFLSKRLDVIQGFENDLAKKKKQLKELPCETPEQQHKVESIKDEIRKTQNKIDQLKSINPDAMQKKDEIARAAYNGEVNYSYYTSSKFFRRTGCEAGVAGLKMGARQMLGLVMAEIWFELRDQVPKIFATVRKNFSLEAFLTHIKDTLNGIWNRIQERFKDFLTSFKDGVFGGVLSSVTTTIFNILATTQKAAIKVIREIWGQLCKAIKLIFFNLENLDFLDLCKAVAGILSAAAGAAIGSTVYAQLLPVLNFPFGAELATFASALVTGLVTLGLAYFLLHSDISKKIWSFMESIMPNAADVKKFQAINVELDRYLTELARLEFNMDTDELVDFSKDLADCNDEMQHSLVIKAEIDKRGIELPFEIGDAESTRKWLSSLAK